MVFDNIIKEGICLTYFKLNIFYYLQRSFVIIMTEITLNLSAIFICTLWNHIDFVGQNALIKEMM
jgi:hypothetical protein